MLIIGFGVEFILGFFWIVILMREVKFQKEKENNCVEIKNKFEYFIFQLIEE